MGDENWDERWAAQEAAIKGAVQWVKAVCQEGTQSKDGRFSIEPEFIGTTRPQCYALKDRTGPKYEVGSGGSIRSMKREAGLIVLRERNDPNLATARAAAPTTEDV